jgi:hypothetical protein
MYYKEKIHTLSFSTIIGKTLLNKGIAQNDFRGIFLENDTAILTYLDESVKQFKGKPERFVQYLNYEKNYPMFIKILGEIMSSENKKDIEKAFRIIVTLAEELPTLLKQLEAKLN